MKTYARHSKHLFHGTFLLALPCAITVVGCGSSEPGTGLNPAVGVGGTVAPTNGGAATESGGATSNSNTGGANNNSNTGGANNNSNTGGANNNSNTGGANNNSNTGGAATGGAATQGGSANGGAATGGRSTGGAPNAGGAATGGRSTGGRAAGGANAGGAATGGAVGVGGNAMGGAATGGAISTGTGGANTGTFDTSISTGEFSFFVISMSFLKSKAPSLSCDSTGKKCTGALGGNLGGLDGADALCTAAAKAASSSDNHQWRAYLSNSSVNAKDRIGTGPWYSAPPKFQNKTNYASEGLLFGTSSTIFSTNRPGDSTTIVWNGVPQSMGQGVATDYPFNMCYTDEFGVCVQNYGDSHDTMTGTTTAGLKSTNHCNGWTSSASSYSADLSHSWPRQLSNVGNDMNWSRSNENHPCVGTINVTTSNEMTGVGSGGGYGAFYCFAYSTGS